MVNDIQPMNATLPASYLLLFAILLLLQGCSASPKNVAAADNSESLRPPPQSQPHSRPQSPVQRFGNAVLDDYRHAYSAGGLLRLAPHIAVHGALANTNADRALRDHWQESWRSEPADDIHYKFKLVGDYSQNRWSVPLYTLGMLAGSYTGDPESDSALATWASRSLRANLLSGPQGWTLTYALGTHRPDVGHSGWNPWNDNDGASGHAMYGAIPILTAARMVDSRPWKYTLCMASTLPALARINFNNHYTSQAYLGWALAYVATGTVAATDEQQDDDTSWLLLPVPGGAVAALSVRF